MNKENFNKNFQEIIENIREYFDLKTELYALMLFERVSKMLSKFLVVIVFVFFLFFFMLFISLGFINWFHEATGTVFWGYMVAAFFYLILGFIVYSMRKRLFINPMLKGFTDVMFEQEDKLDSRIKSKKDNEKDQ